MLIIDFPFALEHFAYYSPIFAGGGVNITKFGLWEFSQNLMQYGRLTSETVVWFEAQYWNFKLTS